MLHWSPGWKREPRIDLIWDLYVNFMRIHCAYYSLHVKLHKYNVHYVII